MKKPKVSVLMSCYNHENYVGKAIESVLNQTFRDFEFRIIDDCSSDTSVEVIKKYKDERIHFKTSAKNQGVVSEFNEMLDESIGEYVTFIGSDDMWREDKLQKQLEIMENNNHIAACFSHMEWVDNEGIPYKKEDAGLPVDCFKMPNFSREQHLRNFFNRANYLGHPSVMVRRSVIDVIGKFDIRLWQAHDFDWWIKICLKWDIYIIQKSLVYYRRDRNQNSISAVSQESEIRVRHEFEDVFLRMMLNIEKKDFIIAFEDIINQKDLTDVEFICERFLVLRNWKIWPTYNSRQVAINFIDRYIQDNLVRECLEKKYSYTLKDYYIENTQLRQPYPVEYYKDYQQLKQMYEEQQKQLRQIHQDYQSTFSWKITKPIRMAKRLAKGLLVR